MISMTKSSLSKSLLLTSTMACTTLVALSSSLAHNGPHGGGVDTNGNPLQPSAHYSGASPIDLKNGLFFNNGTFGLPNEDYETWSKSLEAVGISERNYPYDQRQRFIAAYSDRVTFFRVALENLGQTTSEYPDALIYAKEATATVTPKFDKLKDMLSQLQGASASNWERVQGDARRALADAQTTYYGMHHNPARK